MFAKLDLAALQNSLILQKIFYRVRAQSRTCTSQLSVAIESNDIEKESADNSILIIRPKNKEVLNVLDTMRPRLKCEGADMDTFFV